MHFCGIIQTHFKVSNAQMTAPAQQLGLAVPVEFPGFKAGLQEE